MLQKTLAQQQERWFEEGREEGLEKGREEGREEGRLQVALAMYARGFDLAAIADITGVDAAELAALVETPSQDEDA